MVDSTPWESDLLNRKEEGTFLIGYLLKRHKQHKNSNFVLNINAEWGFGKTYFLENLALDLKGRTHPVIYFDAWKNDFSNEPLLAFIAEIDEQLLNYAPKTEKAKQNFLEIKEKIKRSIVPSLKGFIVNRLTHFGIDAVLDTSNGEEGNENTDTSKTLERSMEKAAHAYSQNALAEHQSIKKSLYSFSKNITELLNLIEEDKSYSLPLFIMIDELDRCRPNYAIEFLEIIKHLFDIPDIIFIIATDSKQLSHSINAVYGNNFASERYLKRFFDQEYTLKTPNNYDYTYYLFEQNGLLEDEILLSGLDQELYEGKNLNVVLFSKFAEFFKLVPRDINQSIIMLSTITLTWDKKHPLHLGYLTFLIMLKQKSNKGFEEYIKKQKLSETFFNSTSEKSMLELGRNLFNRNISIKVHDKLTSDSRKLLLFELIDKYANLNTATLKKLNQISDSDFSIIRKLFSNIIENEHKISSLTLSQYPNMILQAGQFTQK